MLDETTDYAPSEVVAECLISREKKRGNFSDWLVSRVRLDTWDVVVTSWDCRDGENGDAVFSIPSSHREFGPYRVECLVKGKAETMPVMPTALLMLLAAELALFHRVTVEHRKALLRLAAKNFVRLKAARGLNPV